MPDFIVIGLVLVNIITAVTSYMLNSRCTNITTPCMSCDRDVESNKTDNTEV